MANRPGLPVKPGSMGIPRNDVEIVISDDQFAPVADGVQGYLCVRSGRRSMFRTYFRKADAYREKFHGGLYFSGDLAKKDKAGYV